MGVFSAIVLYVVIWWVVLFAILPLWVKPEINYVAGQDKGAPQDHQMRKKVRVTSLIALFLWLILYALIAADIPFLDKLFMD